jgi:hydrogenase maturation protease
VKVLVAGIGNIFLGDDGFGPAVVAAAAKRTWPASVSIVDFGIRGMDLAFALTSGIDAAILVDATARGGEPGTLYVIEPSTDEAPAYIEPPQGHAMDPARVLAFATSVGELPRWVRVVGCEPAHVVAEDDPDVEVALTEPVARAIQPAIAMLERLISEAACTS